MRSLVKSLLRLAAALTGAAAIVAAMPSEAAHRAGPPWISIEYPANPLDPSTRRSQASCSNSSRVWSLVISVVPHEDNIAQALVELGPEGVTSIRVPTRREREWTIPRAITAQEIEQSLQSRTPHTAQARR